MNIQVHALRVSSCLQGLTFVLPGREGTLLKIRVFLFLSIVSILDELTRVRFGHVQKILNRKEAEKRLFFFENFTGCWQIRGRQIFLISAFQLPSAQNNNYAKVAYSRVRYSAIIQDQKYESQSFCGSRCYTGNLELLSQTIRETWEQRKSGSPRKKKAEVKRPQILVRGHNSWFFSILISCLAFLSLSFCYNTLELVSLP